MAYLRRGPRRRRWIGPTVAGAARRAYRCSERGYCQRRTRSGRARRRGL